MPCPCFIDLLYVLLPALLLKIVNMLCFTLQTVQKALLKSDIQSKADKSPVTVADYGTISSNILFLALYAGKITNIC